MAVADVDVDAFGEDQVEYFLPLFLRVVGDLDADEVVQDAGLLDVGEVDLDVFGLEEHLTGIEVARDGGTVQGREAVHVLEIDIDALLEEPAHEVEVADRTGRVEERLLVAVKHVEVAAIAALAQKLLHLGEGHALSDELVHLLVAGDGGHRERRCVWRLDDLIECMLCPEAFRQRPLQL